MKLRTFFISLLLQLPFCINAQVDTTNQTIPIKQLANEIGLHAGLTTGIGLSYRHWFNNIGIQITGFPYIKIDEEKWSSGAITGMFSMYKAHYVRLFSYWGNHIIYTKWQKKNTLFTDDISGRSPSQRQSIITEKKDVLYLSGIGIGASFGRTIKFNIQIGGTIGKYLTESDRPFYKVTGELGLYKCF